MKRFVHPIAREDAETIALKALAFIASAEERLSAFMAETGISLDTLHTRAGDLEILAAALDALMRDEPTLLMFAANAGLAPDEVVRAHAVLSPQTPVGDTM